jgi:hypothetical protein
MNLREAYRLYAEGVEDEPMTFREWWIARWRYTYLSDQEDFCTWTRKDRQWHEVNCLEHLLLENGDTVLLDAQTRRGMLEGVVWPYDPKLGGTLPHACQREKRGEGSHE